MSSIAPYTRFATRRIASGPCIDFRRFQAFYDLHIEDMWLPFFCNSTNLNPSQMEIHETGYAWRFIRKCR